MNKLFTKFSAVALFAMLSGNAMATDYYLSANGVDTNDGTSAEKAVATLSKGINLLKSEEDILHVSGFIKVNEVVRVSKKFAINIQGSSAETDGFDGESKNAILSFETAGNANLTNLTFQNGCTVFDKTRSDARTNTYGALYSYKTNVTLNGCVFKDNKTVLDEGVAANANALGGAVLAVGGGYKLDIKNSQFLTNTSAANGGAVNVFDVDVTVEGTLFKGNVAALNGGALNFSNANSYAIKNSSFIQNEVLKAANNGDGGAIKVYADNKDRTGEYNIEYSTFYGNKADRYGSVYQITTKTAERTVNFTNCTIVGNTSPNGAGAAIAIYNNTAKVAIKNSILEGNVANVAYVDLINSNSNSKATVTITNSVIGNISGYDETVFPSTDSKLNNVKTLDAIKYAGFGAFDANNALPLASDSYAATVKGTDGQAIGAAGSTETPADGSMYVASLKADGTVNEVTIGRHLVGGQWNTICLPFHLNNANEDVNKPSRTEFSTYFGEGAKVACLSGGSVADGILTFSDRSTYNNSDIVAARAYIVKPANDRDIKITKAVVNTNPSSQVGSPKDNSNYKFVGVLAPTDLSTVKTTGQIVCLGKDGKFFTPEEGKTTINGLRGYFIFPASENAARFSIGINGGGTTGINDVKAQDAVKNAKIYTLGGQYMGTNANNLPQGVYVIGSKKVVVK